MTNPLTRSVNIRPKVTVLSVLAHLEYKPWYALAEFVDNSIQSFEESRTQLEALEGPGFSPRVSIEVDPGLRRIKITDNAGGIRAEDFPRAFRPAEIPPNRSGLSEFGMGMKTAACWFAPLWRVTTSVIGEPIQRTIAFDIQKIVSDQIEELEVHESVASESSHFTTIELDNVRSLPAGRTSGKIQQHLSDIYREFLRNGSLVLSYRGETLNYEEPQILFAPRFDVNNEPEDDPLEWRKIINFDFGLGQRAFGFAGLREKGSTKFAGFSLFRRGRVIQGSGDEKYRPPEVFGSPNSFESQRLFGEIHLDGFEVSHTKDGFRWDDNEGVFLDLLREHLDSEPLSLLRQARNYRESARKSTEPGVLENVITSTTTALQDFGGADIRQITTHGPDSAPVATTFEDSALLADRSLKIEEAGTEWEVTVSLSADETNREWLTIAQDAGVRSPKLTRRTLRIRIGLESEFMRRLVRLDNEESLEPVVRIAAGLGLSEHLARLAGLPRAGEVRRNLNRLLSGSLAKRTTDSTHDRS